MKNILFAVLATSISLSATAADFSRNSPVRRAPSKPLITGNLRPGLRMFRQPPGLQTSALHSLTRQLAATPDSAQPDLSRFWEGQHPKPRASMNVNVNPVDFRRLTAKALDFIATGPGSDDHISVGDEEISVGKGGTLRLRSIVIHGPTENPWETKLMVKDLENPVIGPNEPYWSRTVVFETTYGKDSVLNRSHVTDESGALIAGPDDVSEDILWWRKFLN